MIKEAPSFRVSTAFRFGPTPPLAHAGFMKSFRCSCTSWRKASVSIMAEFRRWFPTSENKDSSVRRTTTLPTTVS